MAGEGRAGDSASAGRTSDMTNSWLLAVIVVLGLGGCAGLRQFPETPPNPTKVLEEIDAEYKEALGKMYGSENASAKKSIRNKLIETRMAVIDANFKEFEAGLVKENVRVDFGIALLGIGVGAAGSLAAETMSQILSAVSGGLAGAQAAYGKAVLYDKAMAALIAQMHASRKTVAAQIFQRWSLDIDKYPLWMARTDLDAYYFAGSLPGAILSTAADAKTKDKEADVLLQRAITQQSVTDEMFNKRAVLGNTIDGLDAAKAKALVEKIEAEFPAVKPFIERRYPSDSRAADADGSKAKTVLKGAVVLTVRGPEDAETWQSAIGGL